MSSPDFSHKIMCSSSVTVRQFQPSDANSIEFRAAFVYSSVAEDHSRSLALSEYSLRIGMGTTETEWFNDTRRFFLLFFLISFPIADCLLMHPGGGGVIVMDEQKDDGGQVR